jgi:hypothetical protein
MASLHEIRKAILDVAGNPETGVIKDLVDEIAEAIVALDGSEIKSYDPVKETRVLGPSEKR